MIEIKHRETGAVLRTVEADTLTGAYLRGANLSGAVIAPGWVLTREEDSKGAI